MAENKKSQTTILKEKLAAGEISSDYFVRRIREIAREDAKAQNSNMKDIAELQSQVKALTDLVNDLKVSNSVKEKQIKELTEELNCKYEEESTYTSYDDLKAYVDEHLMLIEAVDPVTNKRFMTNVIVCGDNTDPYEEYYQNVAHAMTGCIGGPRLGLDENGKLKANWSLITVSGKEREKFLDNFLDKLYSCELCENSFGAVPYFVQIGDRNDCSLLADNFEWYFDEQKKYLEQKDSACDKECNVGAKEECKCNCEKEYDKPLEITEEDLDNLVDAFCRVAKLIFE